MGDHLGEEMEKEMEEIWRGDREVMGEEMAMKMGEKGEEKGDGYRYGRK